jgi:uncharacterized protein
MYFAGQLFQPLRSGALFWRAENALLVADLHLEKMSSFARRGSLLPPYDTSMTLKRLDEDLRATGAAKVIALGDSFHRDEGTTTLGDLDRARLDGLLDRADWLWLSGNHDPKPHGLGGTCHAELERHGIILTHQPRRADLPLIAGHLHPAAHIAVNGSAARRPCFVHDGHVMIMPAYGSSTGSINILSAPFHGLLDPGKLDVTMLGKDRLYPVSPKRLIG